MDLITVRELYKHPEEYLDKEVQMGGWICSLCDSKSFGFIVTGDESCFEAPQVIYHDNLSNLAEVSKLSVGTAIIVKDTLVATPDAEQPLEIQTAEVTMEGTSASGYPLQEKRHLLECLRSISHLRPRISTFQAAFRVRSLIAYAIHQYLQEWDFAYVHTLLITGSDCEGTGEVLQVTTLDLNNIPKTDSGKVDFSQDFFNKPTNLAASEQLNAKTYATVFRNVCTPGPTFRAGGSNIARHAAEFWMIEPEIVFVDLDDNVRLAEGMLKHIIKYVLEHAPEEMSFFSQLMDKGLLERLNNVLNAEFGRITYIGAMELLEKHSDKFDYKVSWRCDLQTKYRHYLTEKVFEKPVFATDYPKEIKVFYTKMNPDSKAVATVDCLAPGISEIIGGSQREDNLEKLVARMDELGLNKDNYGSYLDLRRYGSTRHAGFGLDSECYVMYLTEVDNIRDVILFSRTMNNCGL